MNDYDTIVARIHIKDAKTKEERKWALKHGLKSVGITAHVCNSLFIPIYNWAWRCIDHMTKTEYDITVAHPNYERYYSKIVNTFANTIVILTGGLTHEDIDSSTMSAENQKNDFKNYPEILDCIFKKNPDIEYVENKRRER